MPRNSVALFALAVFTCRSALAARTRLTILMAQRALGALFFQANRLLDQAKVSPTERENEHRGRRYESVSCEGTQTLRPQLVYAHLSSHRKPIDIREF
jgi:hypothetical protein